MAHNQQVSGVPGDYRPWVQCPETVSRKNRAVEGSLTLDTARRSAALKPLEIFTAQGLRSSLWGSAKTCTFHDSIDHVSGWWAMWIESLVSHSRIDTHSHCACWSTSTLVS